MNHLRIDQYTHVGHGCPISVELQPADDVVEIVLGEHRLSGGLRIQIDHPDTCARLMASLDDARRQLAGHRSVPETTDPASSRSDSDLTTQAMA